MGINISTIVESIYSEFYPHAKQSEIKAMAFQHRLNNPELYGYIWDEKNEDWVLKYDGGMNRMVDRTGRKPKTSK
jgi:hypothetical protein